MAIKTAPGPGEVVREVKETQILSTTKLENDKRPADFWDYMDALKPEDFSHHILYVYRWIDNGIASPCAKVNVPVDQFGLKDIVGGGSFRLILKNGPQICRRVERFIIEGKQKVVDENTAGAAAPAATGDTNAVNRLCTLLENMLANQNGGSAMADAMKGALALQADGFKSVVTNVRDMTPQNSVQNPFADPMAVMNFLVQAKTIFAPPQASSVTETLKLITLLKESGLMGTGDGKFSLAQEALRLAPQVLGQIGQGMTAMAKARETEALAIIASRSPQAAIPVAANPTPVNTPAVVPPPTSPQPGQPAPPQAEGDYGVRTPNPEWIMLKISELIMDESLSVTSAAEEAISFLQTAAPAILKQLVDGGENTIQYVFNSQPIFQRIPRNPRLSEFIKKFLELGTATPVDPVAEPQKSA